MKSLEGEIVNFSLIISRKWLKSCRKIDKLYTLNNDRLDSVFKIPQLKPQHSITNVVDVGQPRKIFTESSERTKRRKMNDLITSSIMTSPKIIYAANHKIQLSGQRSVVQILKKATISSPITI